MGEKQWRWSGYAEAQAGMCIYFCMQQSQVFSRKSQFAVMCVLGISFTTRFMSESHVGTIQ